MKYFRFIGLYFALICKALEGNMDTARISSKHQVVIPKKVRGVLALKAGDEVFFISRNGIVYLLPKPSSFSKSLRGTAKGSLKYPKNYLKNERTGW